MQNASGLETYYKLIHKSLSINLVVVITVSYISPYYVLIKYILTGPKHNPFTFVKTATARKTMLNFSYMILCSA